MPFPYIQPGLDPTALSSCITTEQLLQMFQAAFFGESEEGSTGAVTWSQNAPDVSTYPQEVRQLWMELDVNNDPTGNIYYYKQGSWELLFTFSGANIIDGTLPLSKLSLTGSAALYIIQVNGAGTALTWTSVPNAIQNGSLALTKLTAAGAGTFFPLSTNGSIAWTATSDFNTYITGLAVNKLAPSATNGWILKTVGGVVVWAAPDTVSSLPAFSVADALKLLRVKSDGSAAEWVAVTSVTGLSISQFTAGSDGQVVRTRGGAAAWESSFYFTPVASQAAIPAVGATSVLFAHGLATEPLNFNVFLKCTDAGGDAGHALNDLVPVLAVMQDTGADHAAPFSFWADATNVGVVRGTAFGSATLYVANKTTGVSTAITNTKWRLVAFAMK